MMPLERYKKRIKELENDPLVMEYVTLNKIVVLAENPDNRMRISTPIETDKRINELDKIESDEMNPILKILRWIGRASNVMDLNKANEEFNNKNEDLKHKIRYQYKQGNLYLISFNESRKFCFYSMTDWVDNEGLIKRFMPQPEKLPFEIKSIKIRTFDGKKNMEMYTSPYVDVRSK